MKQFGVTHLEKQFCKCCVILANPRAKVKKQTEKLIKEQMDAFRNDENLKKFSN
jgi:adenylyl- and sulfurtransferase ThiI